MIRLPHATLTRAHRFLLEIHASGDVDAQRRLIPAGLSRLISCDRAAFNEFDLNKEHAIIPSPTPAYWRRYGAIMLEHLHDHALANPTQCPLVHKAVTFGERRNDPGWRRSPLYHEYYLAVGARHQLSVNFSARGTVRFGLNCNRSTRDFSAVDRAVMELLSPHIAAAWRNASELSMLRLQLAALTNLDGRTQHTLMLDRSARLLADPTPGARELLRKYFGEDAGEGGLVPEPLSRWLRAQCRVLASADALLQPPAVLATPRGPDSLVARLVQSSPSVVIILLEEKRSRMTPRAPVALKGFTRRENEILRWLAEGKRNGEIGIILGLSPRTVGKHLEHIFEKFGVETRTAAARAAFEIGRRQNA